jgi:hypothetical protein
MHPREIRNPKHETRNKSEAANPKSETARQLYAKLGAACAPLEGCF